MTTMKGQIKATRPYAWPYDASFSPATTALMIIDMQNDFCAPGGYLAQQGYDISQTRAVIPALQSLLAAFRAAGFPIFHTREGHDPSLSTLHPRELHRSRHNPSGLGIGDPGPLGRLLIRGEKGHDFIPEVYPREGEVVIDKPGKSAFWMTDLEQQLRVKGIRNLVICGVTTDVCVSSTTREAMERGMDVLVVEDGCAAAERKLHDAAIKGFTMEGGIFACVGKCRDVIEVVGMWKGEGKAEAMETGNEILELREQDDWM